MTPCMGGTCDRDFINKLTEDFLGGMYQECLDSPPRPKYYAGDMWDRGWSALREYRPEKKSGVFSSSWMDSGHMVNGHRLGELHALLTGILIGAHFPYHEGSDDVILSRMRCVLESIEYSWF